MKRVVLFGTMGAYTSAFSRALAPHVELLACFVRRPVRGFIPHLLRHRAVPVEALAFACPVYSLGDYSADATYLHLRRRFSADLAISVGFPRALPVPQLQSLARLGALNLHPALLPHNPGPCPIFWSLKRGENESGVSLHLLTEQLDAGDILLSAKTSLQAGATGTQLFEQLGLLGGELVVNHLPMLLSGEWPLQRQGEPGSWAHKPKHIDMGIVPTEWKARSLFDFVRGSRAFGVPWANLADDVYYFRDALDFEEGRRIPGEFVLHRGELTVAVQDGTVRMLLHT